MNRQKFYFTFSDASVIELTLNQVLISSNGNISIKRLDEGRFVLTVSFADFASAGV